MRQFDAVSCGRAGVWTGSGLLLVMAMTGRQNALLSVLSVFAVAIGVVLLLYSIPRKSRGGNSTRGDAAVH